LLPFCENILFPINQLFDEQNKTKNDELDFQCKENEDPVDFQVRLYGLLKQGIWDFLEKEIVGISDDNFTTKNAQELYNAKKNMLKLNKLFDIKEVLDDTDFIQNDRVLREVVKMLQLYKIRYKNKQQYLSEFFERLLTIGLKQEAGQFFTPPPVTKFIVRSLPLHSMVKEEVDNASPRLPAVIDYAAGSGHFLTEILEEYQNIIDELDTSNYRENAKNDVAAWKASKYSWASKYIYGIEKDYRLVKVAKVGCYFYGDGLAQVIHGDGLDNFEKSKSYRGLLKDNAS